MLHINCLVAYGVDVEHVLVSQPKKKVSHHIRAWYGWTWGHGCVGTSTLKELLSEQC